MERPKIGLALGSGASRGLAHIGVLKALKEENVTIDMIVGTSAGALVGALYCSGIDFKVMESIALGIPRKELLDLSVPRIGFIKGKRIEELVKILTKGMKIEELPIPFMTVATDLVSGEKIVFDSGDIYQAVRASISIPGIFTPVYMGDRVLVDGGIMDRVPVSTAKEIGADIVIGVDVGYSAPKRDIESIFDVIFQSIDIMERELLRNRIVGADILLKPYLPNIDPFRFDQVSECSEEGYTVTKKAIPVINKIIEEKSRLISQRVSGFL